MYLLIKKHLELDFTRPEEVYTTVEVIDKSKSLNKLGKTVCTEYKDFYFDDTRDLKENLNIIMSTFNKIDTTTLDYNLHEVYTLTKEDDDECVYFEMTFYIQKI